MVFRHACSPDPEAPGSREQYISDLKSAKGRRGDGGSCDGATRRHGDAATGCGGGTWRRGDEGSCDAATRRPAAAAGLGDGETGEVATRRHGDTATRRPAAAAGLGDGG